VSPVRGALDPISVLEVDPDLGGDLAGERLRAALAAARARVERLGKGDWDPAAVSPTVGEGFGLLVLSGFLVRRVGREGHFGAELLGAGDLLRPWQSLDATASRPFEPTWQTIAPVELAVLDAGFARRVAPFPEIAARLVDRAMLRARHLALELAIVGQRRVERRLEMLFWQLADRWGLRTRDGVRVEVPLTHALLAELVAARRPSVSTALGKLAEGGTVTRSGDTWHLTGAAISPPGELGETP
jgi:CRP-like cAMP-binding protein